ncbi:unnamed protein product [Sphagnum troendelagicum]
MSNCPYKPQLPPEEELDCCPDKPCKALAQEPICPDKNQYCFIEISGPCGMKKRFAKGTKASFAVERFNCLLKDPNMPVVCIAAVKEGEEPIEFGNDLELILYDNAWTLQIVQEGFHMSSSFESLDAFVHLL